MSGVELAAVAVGVVSVGLQVADYMAKQREAKRREAEAATTSWRTKVRNWAQRQQSSEESNQQGWLGNTVQWIQNRLSPKSPTKNSTNKWQFWKHNHDRKKPEKSPTKPGRNCQKQEKSCQKRKKSAEESQTKNRLQSA